MRQFRPSPGGSREARIHHANRGGSHAQKMRRQNARCTRVPGALGTDAAQLCAVNRVRPRTLYRLPGDTKWLTKSPL